jgi:hypothetical protein
MWDAGAYSRDQFGKERYPLKTSPFAAAGNKRYNRHK